MYNESGLVTSSGKCYDGGNDIDEGNDVEDGGKWRNGVCISMAWRNGAENSRRKRESGWRQLTCLMAALESYRKRQPAA